MAKADLRLGIESDVKQLFLIPTEQTGTANTQIAFFANDLCYRALCNLFVFPCLERQMPRVFSLPDRRPFFCNKLIR